MGARNARCDIFVRGLGLHVFNKVLLRFPSLYEAAKCVVSHEAEKP